MDEEDRLMRTLANRADKAFEDRRKQALKGYQGKGAEFKLAAETDQSAREAVKKSLANPALEGKGYTPPSPHAREYERPKDEGGHSDLSNYFEKQEREEREFKNRLAEEDRKKQEYISSFGTSNLADYERQSAEREREMWRKREEEDRRRKEEFAVDSPALQAYKERQIEEEREFKRRLQEEDKKKKEALDLMQRQDQERREQMAKRSKEDEEIRRQRVAADQAARNAVHCDSCHKQMDRTESVQVKGKTYCYSCSLAAGADKCAGCGKPIMGGSMMKAGAKKFHAECIRCAKCEAPLVGGYRMRRNQMLCINCSQSAF